MNRQQLTVWPGKSIFCKIKPQNSRFWWTRSWVIWFWKDLDAKLLIPGQLLGCPWKLLGITLQTSYVEGRWHQNWAHTSLLYFFLPSGHVNLRTLRLSDLFLWWFCPDYIAKSAIFKIWVFWVIFMYSITFFVSSLKYFRFGLCNLIDLAIFTVFTPNRSLGDDGARNPHRHCHKLQTAVTWVLDELERNKKRKII